MRGHVAVTDLLDYGLELPVDTDAYNSVGGFVFAELGRLPRRGDSVMADGYTIRVESVRENRIEAVRIRERRPAATDGSAIARSRRKFSHRPSFQTPTPPTREASSQDPPRPWDDGGGCRTRRTGVGPPKQKSGPPTAGRSLFCVRSVSKCPWMPASAGVTGPDMRAARSPRAAQCFWEEVHLRGTFAEVVSAGFLNES